MTNPVVFYQSLLGIAPEPLDSVDVYRTPAERFAVVDRLSLVPVHDQRVVSLPLVRVYHAPPANHLDGYGRQYVGSRIAYNLHADAAYTPVLLDPKDNLLIFDHPVPVSFLRPPKYVPSASSAPRSFLYVWDMRLTISVCMVLNASNATR